MSSSRHHIVVKVKKSLAKQGGTMNGGTPTTRYRSARYVSCETRVHSSYPTRIGMLLYIAQL